MRVSLPAVRRIALIALLSFMCVRLADAHLHVCFDGQEPPLTIHAADGSVHNDSHHDDTEHEDRDVELFNALLQKKDGADPDALIVTRLVAFATLSTPVRCIGGLEATCTLPHSPPFIRPPLRGPPYQSSFVLS